MLATAAWGKEGLVLHRSFEEVKDTRLVVVMRAWGTDFDAPNRVHAAYTVVSCKAVGMQNTISQSANHDFKLDSYRLL